MPHDPAYERFDRAVRLGEPALLRLRAETLLQYAAAERFPVTEEEREELERIAAAPNPADKVFLGGFDERIESTLGEDDD
jgi:hypothetical protein